MRKYFKVAAFCAFFLRIFVLGTDRIKILGTVGFEFEQDAIQNGEGCQSKYSVYYFR